MAAALTARMSVEFAQPKYVGTGADGVRAWGCADGWGNAGRCDPGYIAHAETNMTVHSAASLVLRLSIGTSLTPIAHSKSVVKLMSNESTANLNALLNSPGLHAEATRVAKWREIHSSGAPILGM